MASLADFFFDNTLYSNAFREWENRLCTIRSDDCPDELRIDAIDESVAVGMQVKETALDIIEEGKEWIHELSKEEHRDDELLETIAAVIDRLEYDTELIGKYNDQCTAFKLKINLKVKPRRPRIILPVMEYEEETVIDGIEDEPEEESETEETVEETEEESAEETGTKTSETEEPEKEEDTEEDPIEESEEDPEKEEVSVPAEEPKKETEEA